MRLANKMSDPSLSNRHIVCRTYSVLLPDFTNARREATRPPKFRDENFDRDFDSTTLFNDAVQVNESQVAVFAPPFLNLQNVLAATTEIYTLSLHDALPICATSSTRRTSMRVSSSAGGETSSRPPRQEKGVET